jgi:tetratricopeptide (TPR) repeat protein
MGAEASRARTVDLTGVALMMSGDAQGAQQHFDGALRILDAAYGPNYPQMAEVLTHTGDLLSRSLNELPRAQLRYLKALTILESAHGMQHIDVARVMTSLGMALLNGHRRTQAGLWLERAAAVSRACGNREDPDLIIADLLRVRYGYPTNPEEYLKEVDQALSRISDVYEHESGSSHEENIQKFQAETTRWMLKRKSTWLWLPVTIFFWAVCIIFTRRWLGQLHMIAAYEVKPSWIAASIFLFLTWLVVIFFSVLQVLEFWRARHGRPFFGRSESGERRLLRRLTNFNVEFLKGQMLRQFKSAMRQADRFAMLACGDFYLANELYEKSIEIYDHLLASQPAEAPVLRRRALANLNRVEKRRFNERDVVAALTDLDQALELEPASCFGHLQKSRALNLLGRSEEAIEAASSAIDQGTEDPTAWYQRAEAHEASDRHEEAVADFTRAIELSPNFARAITGRGEAYRLLGRHEEAVADLSRVVELNPKDAWAIGSRGQAYEAMGRYQDALTDLTRAIKLNRKMKWAIAERAKTQKLMDRSNDSPTDNASGRVEEASATTKETAETLRPLWANLIAPKAAGGSPKDTRLKASIFAKFNPSATRAVTLAQEEARILHHDYLGTEHLLLGLIQVESVAASILHSMGVSLEALRLRIEEIAGTSMPNASRHISLTLRAKRTLQFSLTEAQQLGHDYIGTEHLLLGLIHDGEGVAVKMLTQMGIDLASIRDRVIEQLDTDNTSHSS